MSRQVCLIKVAATSNKRQYNLEVYEHRCRYHSDRRAVCIGSIACCSGGHSLNSVCTQSCILSDTPRIHAHGCAMACARICFACILDCICFVWRSRRQPTFSSATDSYPNIHMDPHSATNKYRHTYRDIDSRRDFDPNLNFYTNTDPDSESDSNSNC